VLEPAALAGHDHGVLLMAWIYLLWRKQAMLAARLDGLENSIDRAAAAVEQKKKAPKAQA
jgi:hypothetical protein